MNIKRKYRAFRDFLHRHERISVPCLALAAVFLCLNLFASVSDVLWRANLSDTPALHPAAPFVSPTTRASSSAYPLSSIASSADMSSAVPPRMPAASYEHSPNSRAPLSAR
jgi:hypothetical protein